MVEEAIAYVQGESLKAMAAFLVGLTNSPIASSGVVTAMERAKGKLEDLLMLWHEKRGGRPMPSRGDLPVSVLRPWLGNLALVDLTGAIPYFRLCGTGLHARFGGEMTGQKLDAIDDRHGRKALRQAIETVRKNPGPAQQSYTVPRPGGVLTFHELYVPLAFDGEHADTVLFASYAEQSR